MERTTVLKSRRPARATHIPSFDERCTCLQVFPLRGVDEALRGIFDSGPRETMGVSTGERQWEDFEGECFVEFSEM